MYYQRISRTEHTADICHQRHQRCWRTFFKPAYNFLQGTREELCWVKFPEIVQCLLIWNTKHTNPKPNTTIQITNTLRNDIPLFCCKKGFVVNLRTFWRTFSRPQYALAYKKWQISDIYRRPWYFGYVQRQHVPLSCVKLPIQNCFEIFGCFDQPHIASHIAWFLIQSLSCYATKPNMKRFKAK